MWSGILHIKCFPLLDIYCWQKITGSIYCFQTSNHSFHYFCSCSLCFTFLSQCMVLLLVWLFQFNFHLFLCSDMCGFCFGMFCGRAECYARHWRSAQPQILHSLTSSIVCFDLLRLWNFKLEMSTFVVLVIEQALELEVEKCVERFPFSQLNSLEPFPLSSELNTSTRNQGRQDWFAFIFIWQVLNCNVNNNTEHVQQATADIQFPNKSVFVNIIRGNVFLNITKNTSTCHSNTSTWRWFSSAHCALSVEYYRPIRTILTRNTWQSQKKFSCQHK